MTTGGNEGLSTALVRLDDQEARALVAALPPTHVAVALAIGPASDRARALALVPAHRIAQVLAVDESVYDPAFGLHDDPQGPIETLTAHEAKRLQQDPTTRDLVVVLNADLTGTPRAWGLRPWHEQFRASEALERLDAILESSNADDWKSAALTTVSPAYWALALQSLLDDLVELDERTDAIAAIDQRCYELIRERLEWATAELIVEVMEAREEQLITARQAIAVTDTGVGVLDRLAAVRSAKDLLAELRREPAVEKE